MDCVSYGHCEAVHRWFIDSMAKSNAKLTKQTTEEVIKDMDEILKGAIDVDNMYRRMEYFKERRT